MLYIFRYIAYIKRNMSYIFRFMSYIRRIMSYIFRYMSYIFRKLPNCRKKLPKSLELKSILHKKYCLQQRFVAIVGLGLFSVSLFFNIFFCLYLWRLGNSTPLLPQAAKRYAQLEVLNLINNRKNFVEKLELRNGKWICFSSSLANEICWKCIFKAKTLKGLPKL